MQKSGRINRMLEANEFVFFHFSFLFFISLGQTVGRTQQAAVYLLRFFSLLWSKSKN